MRSVTPGWCDSVQWHPGAAFCPCLQKQKTKQKTSLFLTPACFAYAKQVVLVIWIPFYHLRETVCLLDHGFRQGLNLLVRNTFAFLAQLSSGIHSNLEQENCLLLPSPGRFFLGSFASLQNSNQNHWFFWVTGLDKKHASEYKKSQHRKHLQIPLNSWGCSDKHRFPRVYSCLLPKITWINQSLWNLLFSKPHKKGGCPDYCTRAMALKETIFSLGPLTAFSSQFTWVIMQPRLLISLSSWC